MKQILIQKVRWLQQAVVSKLDAYLIDIDKVIVLK